ncbi:MAG: T9SS type A sorting domain-containing protein [Bacteroidota bacterium]|nr:T9SS type A sorting domain-containing protein [Bacteroidota bacterium]
MKKTLFKFLLLISLFSVSISSMALEVVVGKWRLDVDDATGKATVYQSDVLLIPNSRCAFKIGTTKYLQEQLSVQSITQTDLSDGFGTGKLVQIISNGSNGSLTITHNYYLYVDKDYILTDFTVGSAQSIATNYMSPVNTTTASSFLPGTNNRTLSVPFDNDQWVRYSSNIFGIPTTSYEVGAVYNNDTRQGLIIGSIEHTLWKTGINTATNSSNSIQSLEVYGGITSTQTRDVLPHGMVKGLIVKSPKILIGYFTDWRSGLETYADVNALVAPRLTWDSGKPFGWNSWGAIQTNLTYQNATEVSDYISTKLEPNNFSNDSTVYIGLDSYWDNLTTSNLISFVSYCKARGQKAGIYWAPFVDWGKDPNRAVEGAPGYYYKDIYLYANGQPQTIAGAYALDPTHPATKLRVEKYLKQFKVEGFQYLKLDFMTHGSLEGDKHYDPNVFTGIQAYNQGLQHIVDYLGNSMYLNLSISPLFPANYAHGRRIACDAYSSISDTEYTLNSLTYGWWLDHVYSYNDADNVVLNGASEGENRARITSSVITGIFIIGDNFSSTGSQLIKDRAETYLVKPEINRIARFCKAFKPVESGTGTTAANLFITSYADTTYVAAFNYSTATKIISIDFNRIGLKEGTTYVVKELWRNTSTQQSKSWTAAIPLKDVLLYKIYSKIDTASQQEPSNPKFTVYPNPCFDKLEVKLPNGERIKNISIYSMVGVKVRQFAEPSDFITFDNLKSGIYLISATSSSGGTFTSMFEKR